MRRFLQGLGFDNRRIRMMQSPKAKGSGEQYVREQYPKEVDSQRRRSYQKNLALVAVIDADTHSVKQRLEHLDNALKENNLEVRQDDEKIANIVPKRNVETWLKYLSGDDVDEETDYRHKDRQRKCKEQVNRMLEIWQNPPQDSPESLKNACKEFKRVM